MAEYIEGRLRLYSRLLIILINLTTEDKERGVIYISSYSIEIIRKIGDRFYGTIINYALLESIDSNYYRFFDRLAGN